jgi:hypothetical protein
MSKLRATAPLDRDPWRTTWLAGGVVGVTVGRGVILGRGVAVGCGVALPTG